MFDLNTFVESNPLMQIIFNMTGGSAMLLYGVSLMGDGLERTSGKVLKKAISVFAYNLYTAFAAGIFFTMLVQSSMAITVMTVKLVHTGIMTLPQAIGVIYGTNIGTTITAQLMSLNLTTVALPVIAAGFFIMLLSEKEKADIGQSILGFGLLFLGLKTLNSSLPLFKESETARAIFQTYGNNPVLGIVIGMLATMLVQSSSATVGLTISLFGADLISFPAAVGLTLGDNIGTCVTAQLASLRTSTTAQRAAWAHTIYNIAGVIIAIIMLQPFTGLVFWVTKKLLHEPDAFLVANTHTLFNILSAAIFLPVTGWYEKFLRWLIPVTKNKAYG